MTMKAGMTQRNSSNRSRLSLHLKASQQDVPSTSDRRLIELKNQVQCLMEDHLALTQPTQVNKITTPCEICSGPHDTQYCMKDPEQAFVEYASSHTDEVGAPQPQALGTTFEARVRDYMAAHIERMERFKNAIFKQREEINGRMTEMFGLLKELMTSRTPEKVLIREEAKFPVTKNLKEAEMNNEAESEPIKMAGEEETTKVPISQPVEYYLKHGINKKLIEGLVDNHRFNDSLSRTRARKTKRKTYDASPKGPVYEPILRKRITRKEDIGGNFEIPCNIGGQKGINALVDQGSDVNVMPYSTYMKLTDEKPTETFFTTAKASIKFDKGTITLRSGKIKISFHRIPEPSCKIEKGFKNNIEPIAHIMSVNRLVLEWEEKIKLHLEKEMKFNQWRSNNFKSKHPAPVKVEGRMDDNGEVTLYLMRRSLEILRKFHWMILEGRFNQLSKYLSDEPLAIPLDEKHIDDKLHFVEEPVEIMDREVKRSKQSCIPIIKVRWNSRRGPEFTW
ncbi:hypothetical protein Tco_0603184 [Tanacetum coccineum]